MSRESFEEQNQLFENYYETVNERLASEKNEKKKLSGSLPKHGAASYSHSPKFIMDTFSSFFLRFYLMLQTLPENQDYIRKFIEFPNTVRIVAPLKMSEEEIVAETLESARETFEYFDRTVAESFASHVERYLDESCTRTLFNRAGRYYDFDKTEAVVFNHKGKVTSELMKVRVEINERRGRKSKWTPELRRDFLDFYNSCLKIISEAKQSLKKFSDTKSPRKHLKLEYPQIPDDIRALFFVPGKTAEPGEIAIDWAVRKFGVKRTENIRNRVLPLARKEREALLFSGQR